MDISRPTVRKHLNTVEEPKYQRTASPSPKLGHFAEPLTEWLTLEASLPRARRRTARRLFEGLQAIGYEGAWQCAALRYALEVRQSQPKLHDAFVPMVFAPGDACQFNWSQEETVQIASTVQTIKVAHLRMAYSRRMFVVAYPREMQEMVLEAHCRAFEHFGGVPTRLIYDNLKTVADAVLVGKLRQFNRRFLTLANHYQFEHIACTPASGWEKG